MPLARFSTANSRPRLGKVFDDVLIDLSVATPDLPSNTRDFLAAGESRGQQKQRKGAELPHVGFRFSKEGGDSRILSRRYDDAK